MVCTVPPGTFGLLHHMKMLEFQEDAKRLSDMKLEKRVKEYELEIQDRTRNIFSRFLYAVDLRKLTLGFARERLNVYKNELERRPYY